ncbi:MAG: acylneuraminate cytidylyltransferase family protein, partial [Myxococcales bacterium]|nr:acylneuraminate cytidylyltransferase family protein [Myxococcales bacterium]
FARGGSKGVPRKNLAEVGGRPLVARAVDVGRRCPSIDEVFVSTEDEEIAECARAAGATVAFLRPAELATDRVAELLAWRHAIETLRAQGRTFDTMVSLPATCPLRAVDDVEAAITLYRTGGADMVVSTTATDVNPWFNLVTRDPDGSTAFPFKPAERIVRRQDAAPVLKLTAVAYVTSPAWVMTQDNVLSGRLKSIVVPPERGVDIDSPLDLAFARFLAESGA